MTTIGADEFLGRLLAACEVDPASVEMQWNDLCHEDVLKFPAADFPDAVLDRLAELNLTFPSRFEFPSSDIQDRFEAAVRRTPAMLQAAKDSVAERRKILKERALDNFPGYLPASESLAEFASRAEKAVGLERECALRASGDTILFGKLSGEMPSFADVHVLLSLVEAAAPGVQIRILSQTID